MFSRSVKQAQAKSSEIVSRAFSTGSVCNKWQDVPMGPPDPILGITVAFKEDPSENKINLGVGAYRDDKGNPYVLSAVREAEEIIFDKAQKMEYAPIGGEADFTRLAAELALGADNSALNDGRVASAQSLSGTGALRLAGAFLERFAPSKELYLPTPSWGNHTPIFRDSGLNVKQYAYYNPETVDLDFEAMIKDIQNAPKQSNFLFHACAHNPTGIDPSIEQWQEVSQVCKDRDHTVLVDCAYQGFASGNLDDDAAMLRLFVNDGHNVLLAQSFAKNMGLYGQRCGAFSVVANTKEEAKAVDSQVKILIRPMYSSPPVHPARIATEVMSNPKLRELWIKELKGMADRIISVRQTLKDKLVNEYGSTRSWDNITSQIGMFCYSGLTADQVDSLRENHSIYMTRDGRISMAGVTTGNVDYLAKCIAEVTK